MVTYVGIDAGGTNIKGGLVSPTGKILNISSVPTASTKNRIIEDIGNLVYELSREDTASFGLGIAGPIDKKGRVYPPNIRCLRGVNIKSYINRYNIPGNLENDSNCFLLGERFFGGCKKNNDILGITLGTGTGGSIMIDGKLFRGKDGAAGEIGHMVLDCNDDKRHDSIPGSFENIASGTAIERRFKEKYGEKYSCEEIAKIAKKDKRADSVLKDAWGSIGIASASLANIFNPEVIVLGGSVSRTFKDYKRYMKKEFDKRCIKTSKSTKIMLSNLENPGIIGAAVLGMKAQEPEIFRY